MATLITGGAGFIGSSLAEMLIARGETVHVLDDLSTGSIENIQTLLGEPQFHFLKGSVCDADAVEDSVSRCDRVFHLAAAVGVQRIMDDPLGSMKTNVQGTENILMACAKHQIPVLITSSSEVYGRSAGSGPLSEDTDSHLGPTSVQRWSYACTKMLGEFLAFSYHSRSGLPVVIVRLFNVIGPRQVSSYGMVVPTFVEQALSGRPITVHGDGLQTRTFVHVQDVVNACFALMERPESIGKVFNIGGEQEITIRELAQMVKKITGSKSTITQVPYNEVYGKGFEDMLRRVPSIDRLREAIGYRPMISLDAALSDIVASNRIHLSGKQILT